MKGKPYMYENEVQHRLIEILYAAVNELESTESIKQKITPDIFPAVYRLAKKHDLAHIVSNFVYRNKIEIDSVLQGRLQQEEIMSVYRHEQMKYAFEEICGVFDEVGVKYIPLKGSVLRSYYPYESMRTSCDIDILIHEEDLDTAINGLKNKGYRYGERNYHDVSLYAPNKIHLELHFNIQENIKKLDAVLKDAWKYAVLTNGSQYAFKKEFFAFHIFAHMAYHFLSGGCGIRPLLDIWVMEHKMGINYECARELLEKAGIYNFAAEISRVSEICFSGNPKDEFSDTILFYIFSGGVYGTSNNKIAVKKSKSRSTLLYALKRLFPTYNSMKVLYPILKKTPYLLPFCWIARWITALFGGKSKRVFSEMKRAQNMSDEKIKEVTEICSRLGL